MSDDDALTGLSQRVGAALKAAGMTLVISLTLSGIKEPCVQLDSQDNPDVREAQCESGQ